MLVIVHGFCRIFFAALDNADPDHLVCTDTTNDGDHVCDYGKGYENGCQEKLNNCADADNDGNHKCDECGADNITACGDSTKDHVCDTDSACNVYNTGDNAHTDAKTDDGDHNCDYCGKADENSVCADIEPKNHVCDADSACNVYKTGDNVCQDTDFDHDCDYGCSATFGECSDKEDDGDHLCDYGEQGENGCKKALNECSDAEDDNDHICDECGAENVTEHVDANKDHKCDECETEMGKHEDTNNDHKCEYGCDVAIGEHADGDDKNHTCDYCQGAVEGDVCVDTDKDHKCDECETEMGKHEDTNNDHKCEYGCDVAIGDHADGDDKNHTCDYCQGAVEGDVCVDTDKDHKCDECETEMGKHEDTNNDHKCEYGCDVAIGEHADSADDKDHLCDYGCNVIIEECSDRLDDADHDCDICGKEGVTEHVHAPVVTDPTCEADGYTTYTCNCGNTYVDDKVGALGHDYHGEVTTAPTYSTTGVMTYTCKNDATHTYTEVIPVLDSIELIMNASNATVPGASFTDASLIALTVTVNSLTEMSAYGFEFYVEYGENVEYVGEYEFVKGTPFSNGLVSEKDGTVHITAYAPNKDGHVQNVVLDGEQALVTLYFRVKTGNIEGDSTTAEFKIADAYYTAEGDDYTNIQLHDEIVVIKKLMDANGDGNLSLSDIQIGNMILTGEMMDGDKYVSYDVTLDVDKDGEITAYDLMQVLLFMHDKLTYDEIIAM